MLPVGFLLKPQGERKQSTWSRLERQLERGTWTLQWVSAAPSMVLRQTRAHLSNPEMPALIDAFISQFHAAKKYRCYFNIPVSFVFRAFTSVNILSLLSPHLDPSHSSQLEETDAFQPHSKWFTTTMSLGVSGRLHGVLAVANPSPRLLPLALQGQRS